MSEILKRVPLFLFDLLYAISPACFGFGPMLLLIGLMPSGSLKTSVLGAMMITIGGILLMIRVSLLEKQLAVLKNGINK